MTEKKVVQSVRKLSDVVSKGKLSKDKSNLAKATLGNLIVTKDKKKLDEIFSLIKESNEADETNLDNYLMISCMYYIKKKYSLSLGILYKAREIEPHNMHVKKLIYELEEKLVNIQLNKNKKNNF
ncbi:MAG: hypothetical protein U0457_14845 [Candidatus Sericytochromatia bacterium]